ncbi:MAG: serine/threonine-protein phosphatase, partial [Bacteroidia bacterium]|nr:serine/threonine-protein phosphatase [Bacteroidia bacterium]
QMCLESGDSLHMANLYIGKANSFGALNRVNEIEPLLKYALSAAERYDSKKLKCVTLMVYSDFFKEKGKLDSAIKYVLTANEIALGLNEPRQIQTGYRTLYELYELKKDHEKALRYLERVVGMEDSLSISDFDSKLANMKSLFDLDAKDNEIAILTKDGVINKEQLAKQKTIIFSAAGGGVLLFAFLFLAYRAYRRKKRDAVILENQKQEIEFKSLMLEEKNSKISEQKDLIEEKNKEMLDSIKYAKRIQASLLASTTLLSKNLPEYFVFYRPKDIVSGDFYWATELRKLRPGKMFQEKGTEVKGINEASEFILVIGDCTGHGVPGAFMSLLNISKLSETINEKKINKPGLILDAVRKEIIHVLNPPAEEFSAQEEVKDGMDCTLIRLDLESMTLNYAAANNPFYVLRNGQINSCPADKMPVGKSPTENISFSTYTVPLQKGDIIYLMTDGYADQFGGPKGKKFKYKALQNLLKSGCDLSMSEQKKAIENAFAAWKGSMEQIDDVCIVGIKI